MTDQIQKQYKESMNTLISVLSDMLPGCAVTLLIAPFNQITDGRVNYISNANRDDVRAMLKEFLARDEGQSLHRGKALPLLS